MFSFHFFSLPSVATKESVTNELGTIVRPLNPWLMSRVRIKYKNSKIEMVSHVLGAWEIFP